MIRKTKNALRGFLHTRPPQQAARLHFSRLRCAIMLLFRDLSNLNVEDIIDYVATSDAPYEPSQLYATAVAANVEESSIRKSESRTFTDERLFSLCKTLVNKLSASDSAYNYTVVPDNLTHIRYRPGGFFARHVDHCRGTSNIVEEFTLIVNVQPPNVACTGGHTAIHHTAASGAAVPFHFDLTQPGRGLLFRKDVEHEGMPVESGEKHVLCLNLWGRRKDRRGQVLLVSINSPDAGPAADKAAEPVSALRAASSDAVSFALAAEDAAASHVLKLVLADASKKAEAAGASAPAIVRYAAPDGVLHEAFDVVFRVCCRMHVTTAMMEV